MSGPEFFSISIGEYDDQAFKALDADGEAARIRSLLERFGVTQDAAWSAAAPRGIQAIEARLDAWATTGAQMALLYWVGHGLVNAEKTVLATGSTNRQTGSGTFEASRLASYIALRGADEAQPDRWIAVFIDACKSAGFVREVGAELLRKGTAAHYLLFGTSEPGSMTRLGRFRSALELALEGLRTVEHLELTRLTREIQHYLDPAGIVIPQQVDHAVLHNAWAVPAGMLTPADRVPAVEEVMKTLSAAERQTLIDAASGGALGTTTWFYTGRERELAEVATWLRGQERLLIVTGAPGSGKSAFLGNLLLRSNRSVWEMVKPALQEDVSHEGDPPQVAPFAGALRLTGLTLADAVVRISERLGLDTPSGMIEREERIDWLCDRLAERAADLSVEVGTLLIDSLDEAAEPIEIAQAVLARIAATGGIRLVVGTRWSTSSELDAADDDDRDLLIALRAPGLQTSTLTLERDGAGLLDYVTRRLRILRDGRPQTFDADELAPLCNAIADASPDFLFARLAMLEVGELRGLVDLAAVSDLVAGNHTRLFARAVSRLSSENTSYTSLLNALAVRRGRGLPAEQGLWADTATAFSGVGQRPSGRDIQALVRAAGPYLVMDHEAGSTVYRLAHESYETFIREGLG